jgi:hypothetical protein
MDFSDEFTQVTTYVPALFKVIFAIRKSEEFMSSEKLKNIL